MPAVTSLTDITEKVLIREPLTAVAVGGKKRTVAAGKKKSSMMIGTTVHDNDQVLRQEIENLPKRLRTKAAAFVDEMRKRNLLKLDSEGRFQFDSASVRVPEGVETSYLHTLLHWFLTNRKASEKANLQQPLDADRFEQVIIHSFPILIDLVARDKLHNGRRRKRRASPLLVRAVTDATERNKWIKLNL